MVQLGRSGWSGTLRNKVMTGKRCTLVQPRQNTKGGSLSTLGTNEIILPSAEKHERTCVDLAHSDLLSSHRPSPARHHVRISQTPPSHAVRLQVSSVDQRENQSQLAQRDGSNARDPEYRHTPCIEGNRIWGKQSDDDVQLSNELNSRERYAKYERCKHRRKQVPVSPLGYVRNT